MSIAPHAHDLSLAVRHFRADLVSVTPGLAHNTIAASCYVSVGCTPPNYVSHTPKSADDTQLASHEVL